MRHCMHFSKRWIIGIAIMVVCFALTACSGDSSNNDNPSPDTNNNDNGGGGGGGTQNPVTLTITLPADQSTLAPYVNYPAVDTTPCLSCHNSADVTDFTSGEGPQFRVTNEFCRQCHSANYITSQPPLTMPAWQKVVDKMEAKFGAKLAEDADSTVHKSLMVDYLTHVYGTP